VSRFAPGLATMKVVSIIETKTKQAVRAVGPVVTEDY